MEYLINVHLPPTYGMNHDSYPVIYYTDALFATEMFVFFTISRSNRWLEESRRDPRVLNVERISQLRLAPG